MMVLLGTFATRVVGGVGVLKIVVLLIRVDLVVLIQGYTKRFLGGKTLQDIHIIAYQSITFPVFVEDKHSNWHGQIFSLVERNHRSAKDTILFIWERL